MPPRRPRRGSAGRPPAMGPQSGGTPRWLPRRRTPSPEARRSCASARRWPGRESRSGQPSGWRARHAAPGAPTLLQRRRARSSPGTRRPRRGPTMFGGGRDGSFDPWRGGRAQDDEGSSRQRRAASSASWEPSPRVPVSPRRRVAARWPCVKLPAHGRASRRSRRGLSPSRPGQARRAEAQRSAAAAPRRRSRTADRSAHRPIRRCA